MTATFWASDNPMYQGGQRSLFDTSGIPLLRSVVAMTGCNAPAVPRTFTGSAHIVISILPTEEYASALPD